MLAKALTIAALTAAATAQQQPNLTTLLQTTPQLSNLTAYLSFFPALVNQLSELRNVTLLAPNNAAIAAAMNSSYGQAFQANDTALIEGLFQYHVLNGTYHASDVTSTPAFIPTILGPQSNLTTLQSGAVVEAVRVGRDVRFISGLLGQTGVVSANHNFTGGTLHIVDSFLTLPQNISVDVVSLNLTDSAGAIEKANLAAQGSQLSNVTAFIPNNAAWRAIANIAANLTVQQLQATLGYHLVPDVVMYSTDLTNMTLETLTQQNVTITNDNGTIFVNSARVVTPDILAFEGMFALSLSTTQC